jgi:hypothetical protein
MQAKITRSCAAVPFLLLATVGCQTPLSLATRSPNLANQDVPASVATLHPTTTNTPLADETLRAQTPEHALKISDDTIDVRADQGGRIANFDERTTVTPEGGPGLLGKQTFRINASSNRPGNKAFRSLIGSYATLGTDASLPLGPATDLTITGRWSGQSGSKAETPSTYGADYKYSQDYVSLGIRQSFWAREKSKGYAGLKIGYYDFEGELQHTENGSPIGSLDTFEFEGALFTFLTGFETSLTPQTSLDCWVFGNSTFDDDKKLLRGSSQVIDVGFGAGLVHWFGEDWFGNLNLQYGFEESDVILGAGVGVSY